MIPGVATLRRVLDQIVQDRLRRLYQLTDARTVRDAVYLDELRGRPVSGDALARLRREMENDLGSQ